MRCLSLYMLLDLQRMYTAFSSVACTSREEHPKAALARATVSKSNRAASRTFVTATTNDNNIAAMPVQFLRRLVRPSIFAQSSLVAARPSIAATPLHNAFAGLSLGPTPASRANKCTLIQVLRQGRIQQRARKLRSPQLANRPELKGVCLKVGTTKPKKPNSGERKIARVRLSTGKVITAYIPGEGMS